MVAGGLFPRLYHNLPIRDIDVYANSYEDFCILKGEYVEAGFKVIESHKNYMKLQATDGMFLDLINFHNPKGLDYLDYFDFTISQCAFKDDQMYDSNRESYPMSAWESIVKKVLVFNDKMPAVSFTKGTNNTLTRLQKYTNLGFTISDEELTKMFHFWTNYFPEEKRVFTPYT
jgi:hypothetical protein